ncbi:MAG: hypothetical protein R3C20_13840 [Planctomycetaceae bacterium]
MTGFIVNVEKRSRFARRRRVAAPILVGGILMALASCVSSPPQMPYSGASAIYVSVANRDLLWERAVSVLNYNHFLVARESKLEGVIETEFRAGANLLEPWHPDSIGFENRLESTLQSIRRRVVVTMQAAAPGQTSVSVRVDKEIEDLPGLAASYEGGATFREGQPLQRDLTQVIGQSAPSRWLPIGRDTLLEQKLLREISGAAGVQPNSR